MKKLISSVAALAIIASPAHYKQVRAAAGGSRPAEPRGACGGYFLAGAAAFLVEAADFFAVDFLAVDFLALDFFAFLA